MPAGAGAERRRGDQWLAPPLAAAGLALVLPRVKGVLAALFCAGREI